MKKLALLTLALTLPLTTFAAKKAGQPLSIDAEKTKITWEGKKKIGGAHQGTLKVKSGTLEVAKGEVVKGEVLFDMTTLDNTDLGDGAMKTKLVGHLKNDDFFSVEKHPTALLAIKNVKKDKDGKYTVNGDLTIKGVKKPISFPAEIHSMDDGVHATANITVDRTAYGIKYNSLKFFSAIGDKAIEDTFTVSVDLTAKK